MGDVAWVAPAGAVLVREVEQFLADQAEAVSTAVQGRVAARSPMPQVWSSPGLREMVTQVGLAPAEGMAEQLSTAIDVLRRDGWTQGDGFSSERGHCLWGAVSTAGVGFPEAVWRGAISVVALTLAAATGRHLSVIGWNDSPDRTEADVLGLLGDAVAVARDLGAGGSRG